MSVVPDLVAELRGEVLEAPCWDADRRELICVDVMAGSIYRWCRDSETFSSVDVGQPVGAAALRASGGIVVAMRDGIAILGDRNTRPRLIASIDADDPAMIMNDAKCDPAGRLWAGTTHVDELEGAGTLYRVDESHRPVAIIGGVTLSNGLGWSPDGSRMYYIDSPTCRVDMFDFDAETGTPSNRRSFVEIAEPTGIMPDGLAVDADGGVWVALWGGGCVRRYSSSGSLDAEIRLPVSQVTSCAFGGPDLDELYVTTAAYGLSDGRRAMEPSAGGLFRCVPGVEGLPTSPYAG